MSDKGRPGQNDKSKKHQKKDRGKIIHNSSVKKKLLNESLKLIHFENSLASKAKDADILRACSVYNKTRAKIINLKIGQIYFN